MLKELSNHAPVSINGFTIVSNFLRDNILCKEEQMDHS